MTAARAIVVVVVLAWGVAWAIVTYISRQGPHYWDAVTALDFAAVWSYSAALTLSALVIWITAWLARTNRRVAGLAIVVGAGLLVTAVANAIEDGFGLKSAGSVYVIGAVIGGYGSIILAVALAAARAPVLAVVAIATAVGAVFVASVGGFAVFAVSLWFAARLIRRPDSLAPRPKMAVPDAHESAGAP